MVALMPVLDYVTPIHRLPAWRHRSSAPAQDERAHVRLPEVAAASARRSTSRLGCERGAPHGAFDVRVAATFYFLPNVLTLDARDADVVSRSVARRCRPAATGGNAGTGVRPLHDDCSRRLLSLSRSSHGARSSSSSHVRRSGERSPWVRRGSRWSASLLLTSRSSTSRDRGLLGRRARRRGCRLSLRPRKLSSAHVGGRRALHEHRSDLRVGDRRGHAVAARPWRARRARSLYDLGGVHGAPFTRMRRATHLDYPLVLPPQALVFRSLGRFDGKLVTSSSSGCCSRSCSRCGPSCIGARRRRWSP